VGVVEVIVVVAEIFEPRLVVRYDFPVALPVFLVCPSCVAPVEQHQIEFVAALVVFAISGVLVKFSGLVDFPLKRGSVMDLFVDPVCKGVAPLFLELFHVVLEVDDALSPHHLLQGHSLLHKLRIVRLLQLPQALTLQGYLRHLVSV
jgi:hypothetical protein